MKTQDIKIIEKTFQKIADMVTPTMGAKGQMAVIADEMGRPFLTDDGVTVAKECLKFDEPFEKMVAMSLCEAAHNTEKVAFDGTTLTVLLTNEFYKAGKKLINSGIHPQVVADVIAAEAQDVYEELKELVIPIKEENEHLVKDVAYITTKMPGIGELVYEAYKKAGPNMNVVIEHERNKPISEVEHTDGMIIDSGYFSESLRQLGDSDGKFRASNAKCILLGEGTLTVNGIKALFNSITDPEQPLIFFLPQGFNPDSMKQMMDLLVQNKLRFMIVFINDSKPEEIMADIAAKTNGKVQSGSTGTLDYTLEMAGTADKIVIEQNKTTIIAQGSKEDIDKRLAYYNEELNNKKYELGFGRADAINRRIANLDKGVVKIKLATPTITEFATIRLKLDDAIGAVRCACKDGVILGAGKTLYLLGKNYVHIGKALQAPAITIIKNSGYPINTKVLDTEDEGLDVRTGKPVKLLDAGIIDSVTSVKEAIKNAASIATEYLRAYILINGQA